MKARLDNNPTDWVIVKRLSGSVDSGWLVPVDALTDSEINNLDEGEFYSVSSVLGSDSDLGLTSSEATAKVAEHRDYYADYMQVNAIFKIEMSEGVPNITTRAPTNADMSGY
jgi:hypothetical protein